MTETPRDTGLALRVDSDLITALKSRDETTLATLRLLKSAAKNQEVAKRRPLTDEEYGDVIRQQVKMRRDAATEYDKAGRPELAGQERAELSVLQRYLPAQLDQDAIREVVRRVIVETGATNPGDLGRVMGASMRELEGKADGAVIRATAQELLAGQSG